MAFRSARSRLEAFPAHYPRPATFEHVKHCLIIGFALAATRLAAAQTPADTTQWPATYATALPTLVFYDWEKDFGRYERFVTKEIARTQQSLGFVHEGVSTWWVANSARPHAQLDTATRIADPAQITGTWRSILTRTVIHRDSAALKEEKFYRSTRILPAMVQAEMTFSDGKVSYSIRDLKTDKAERVSRKKYALINGRFLLIKCAVSQVGIDARGRLVLHASTVTERKINGRYLTYEARVTQTVFERQL